MKRPTVYPSYLWWVIPEKLAGMPRPALENLPQLYQAGLRGIVSVIDEPSLIMEYQKAKFSALSLPIVEDLPPTLPQVAEFIKFAETIMSNNQAVAVHCTGGNHRTGTLLASYLVAKRENPEAVIQRILQIHPTAQLSQAQTQWLYQLPELLKSDHSS